ncbi:MAG: antibiotic biosynthesis monooxygenase [Flavobacteriales bacterium]|nr:antibiotic biosynthesis monooxygenase [Flavobacteriales bacterium]MCZ2442326.1 antibiotic biosynthesis monooxygenase [Flavobacteriales bacterium]
MTLLRIVRMSFQPEQTAVFKQIFAEKYPHISRFEGCLSLRLMQDERVKNIFYTISEWQSAEHLEAYRQSALFNETWAKTKLLFDAPPKAYSLVDTVF